MMASTRFGRCSNPLRLYVSSALGIFPVIPNLSSRFRMISCRKVSSDESLYSSYVFTDIYKGLKVEP